MYEVKRFINDFHPNLVAVGYYNTCDHALYISVHPLIKAIKDGSYSSFDCTGKFRIDVELCHIMLNDIEREDIAIRTFGDYCDNFYDKDNSSNINTLDIRDEESEKDGTIIVYGYKNIRNYIVLSKNGILTKSIVLDKNLIYPTDIGYNIPVTTVGVSSQEVGYFNLIKEPLL